MKPKSTMASWKTRKLRKAGKRSQTAGREKVNRCQAGPDKKYFAKSSRSYKHRGYAEWSRKTAEMNRTIL